ncbi:hypothetical protein FQZ97_979930 [compost metagenome]
MSSIRSCIHFKSSGLISEKLAWADMPALTISVSIRPKEEAVFSMRPIQALRSVTSVGTTRTLLPDCSISAASACNFSTLRAARTSAALFPSRMLIWRAVSAPMPSDAPVMIVTSMKPSLARMNGHVSELTIHFVKPSSTENLLVGIPSLHKAV